MVKSFLCSNSLLRDTTPQELHLPDELNNIKHIKHIIDINSLDNQHEHDVQSTIFFHDNQSKDKENDENDDENENAGFIDLHLLSKFSEFNDDPDVKSLKNQNDIDICSERIINKILQLNESLPKNRATDKWLEVSRLMCAQNRKFKWIWDYYSGYDTDLVIASSIPFSIRSLLPIDYCEINFDHSYYENFKNTRNTKNKNNNYLFDFTLINLNIEAMKHGKMKFWLMVHCDKESSSFYRKLILLTLFKPFKIINDKPQSKCNNSLQIHQLVATSRDYVELKNSLLSKRFDNIRKYHGNLENSLPFDLLFIVEDYLNVEFKKSIQLENLLNYLFNIDNINKKIKKY